MGFISAKGKRGTYADAKQQIHSHVSCATRDIIRCVMCLAQYARLVYYSDILLMSVLSDYSYCIHVHVHE